MPAKVTVCDALGASAAMLCGAAPVTAVPEAATLMLAASAAPPLATVKVTVMGSPGSMTPLPLPPASAMLPSTMSAAAAPHGVVRLVHTVPRPPVYSLNFCSQVLRT